MSQEHAWPAAWRRGHEASEPDARRAGPQARKGVRGALVLAGLPQAFDLFVFGAVSLAVFPQVFLAGLAPAAAVAVAVGVWVCAYIVAWPAGAALARLGARWDPKVRMGLARALFTVSTLSVAILPATGQWAWAPLLLVILRLGQGLALGGLAQGHAQGAPRRELLPSRALAGLVGLAAAALILGVFALALPTEDFLAWGWRYPFVLALALNMTAFFGDLQVAEAQRKPAKPRLRLVTVDGVRTNRG